MPKTYLDEQGNPTTAPTQAKVYLDDRGESPTPQARIGGQIADVQTAAVQRMQPPGRNDPRYLLAMLSNLPESAWRVVTDTVGAVPEMADLVSELHPSEMARRMTTGEPSKLLPFLQNLPGALYDRFVSRYGTPEAREATVRDDPAGMVSDIASLVSGGKAVTSGVRRAVAGKAPFANPNPAARAAVQFGERAGVPIDAATASGNRFVRGAQRIADESIGGSVVAERGREAQAAGLTRAGEGIAARVYPNPVTPEQAGQAVRTAVETHVTESAAAADAAYARLRALEQSRPVTVNVQAAKSALQPIYDDLLRQSELNIPMMGGQGRALRALDGLMRGPDQAPLSVVDSALGDLKSLARGADLPALRTKGQGTAAAAVSALEQQVQTAARQAGRPVHAALMEGRLATRAKFGAADVLDTLKAEPVQTFNSAIWAKDAGIEKLRGVARLAPQEMAQIGRAYIEDALSKATAQGGFSGADGLYANWQKLGPETKRLLFKGETSDLDSFFLLAKKMGENPNPSGTALTLLKSGEMGGWVLAPATGIPYSISAAGLAKLLRYPPAVKLLTRGMAAPAASRASVRPAQLAAMARAAGVELTPVGAPIPAMADTESGASTR